MNKVRQTVRYITFDFLAAVLAWASLFLFRKLTIDGLPVSAVMTVFQDANFWWGITLLPVAWLCLYAMQGTYHDVYHKARLKELQQTLSATLIGVVIIFFLFLLDDDIRTYRLYYASLLFLFLVHFGFTYLFRVVLTSATVRRVHSRQIGFPTILVGSGRKAYDTYIDLENQEVYSGQAFVGFVSNDQLQDERLAAVMPCLGTVADLESAIIQYDVEEVIVASDELNREVLNDVFRVVNRHEGVVVRLTPNLRDFIVGSVKIDSIFHSPLVTVSPRFMEYWQYSLKRIADVLVSFVAMLVLSPVYLVTAIVVKMTSPGPVFYSQERVGKGGIPFKMHKFRSMYIDAEKFGPALSKDNDPRITPFGRFMRKVRLDEIPQFYNVLCGTMSLVGPRPERQFFIDQIVEKAPEYLFLQKVKPGITSWGQVKYGYAENVDEMVERLRYDLLYLENMSLATDVKILLYTIIIVVQGRGK